MELVPPHILITSEKVLYIISKLDNSNIKILAEAAEMKYENIRAVTYTLESEGMIKTHKADDGYHETILSITDAGRLAVSKMTAGRKTNTARTSIFLHNIAKKPMSVMTLLEAHFSENNREQSAIQNVYQRLLLMARDGFIIKRDHSKSMMNAEYIITARGLAKLHRKDLSNYPIIKPKKIGVRKDSFSDGIKIRNPNFRITPRTM